MLGELSRRQTGIKLLRDLNLLLNSRSNREDLDSWWVVVSEKQTKKVETLPDSDFVV